MDKLLLLNPILLAFFATLFTYFLTLLGALVVVFFKKMKNEFLNILMALGAGIMFAACIFSLLLPALELDNVFICSIGILLGGITIIFADIFLNKILKKKNITSYNTRSILLVFAVTLHNIPEGMAIGVAFGGLMQNQEISVLLGAIMLAFGIGIQNFPEGAAVSLPLRKEGCSISRSVFIGQASGIVEPIAGVIGALCCVYVSFLLPFLLTFSCGAMVAVCVSELIPEASKSNKNLATLFFIIGFLIMMLLDVLLG